MIASDRYSPPKMGASYHALVLFYEYATFTNYTCTNAIAFSAGLNGLQVPKLIKKTIHEALLTHG